MQHQHFILQKEPSFCVMDKRFPLTLWLICSLQTFCGETELWPRLNYKTLCCPQLSSLQTENTTLKTQTPGGQQHHPRGPFGRHQARGGRAMSMYETGTAPKHYPHRVETARPDDGVVLQPFPTNVSTQALLLLMIV